MKQQSILTTVAGELSKVCSCPLSVRYIAHTQLTCGDHTTDRVILEGTLVALSKITETKLHQHLQDWVDTSPTIEVTGVSLQVIKCSSYPSDKESCIFKDEVSEPSSTSLPPMEFSVKVATLTAAKEKSIPVTVYAGIGGAVVVGLGITCIAVTAVYIIKRRRSQAYKTNG